MLDNYDINKDGLIFQKEKQKFIYNEDYIKERYDTYGNLNSYMSYLRYGNMVDHIDEKINKILDIGYGNGSFLKFCEKIIDECYGYDISGYPLPYNVKFCENWLVEYFDVVTLFDVIEHFEDPYILKNLNTKYIVISTPWCHNLSDEWFENWKHRRPNEHLWFFNDNNIENFAKSINCEIIHSSNIEDMIRNKINGLENILTVILKKNN